MSQLVVADRTADALLLRSELDGIVTEVADLDTAQRAMTALRGDMKRTLGFQRSVSEAVESVTWADVGRPQLGGPRRQDPQRLRLYLHGSFSTPENLGDGWVAVLARSGVCLGRGLELLGGRTLIERRGCVGRVSRRAIRRSSVRTRGLRHG